MDFLSLSPQEIRDLANPAPEYTEAVKSFNFPTLDWSDPDVALAGLRTLTSNVSYTGSDDAEVDEESLTVRTRDEAGLELRVFRLSPASPSYNEDHAAPLIVLFHGGHHVLGSPTMLSNICGSLAAALNAVVVSAGYRLAPEHTFPTAVDDAWDVLSWCAKNATKNLYADPTQGFIIGGVASGGSMSVVLSHMARDQGLQPPLTGLYLAAADVRVPNNDPSQLPDKYKDRFISRTQDECVNSEILPQQMSQLMDSLYRPDKTSELYAPLLWSSGHEDLPRTYLQVCGIDTSRDEGLIYAEMLQSENVPVKVELYKGLPHGFWTVLPSMLQSEKWKEDTIEGFKWLLQKG